ncbi:MAG: hypothetical protein K1X83_09545 [Oligoflexia bacterium]|nr:hypothetical protein [Oligoflexia bacterium]
MKKSLPVIIIFVALVAGIWYASNSKTSAPGNAAQPSTDGSGVSSSDSDNSDIDAAGSEAAPPAQNGSNVALPNQSKQEDEQEEDEEVENADERPAAQVYKSAEEALKAVKDGAADYDDIVLEQFTQPGEDCSWCPEFYKSIRDQVSSDQTSEDEKSYYSELLAISGRVDNVASLVEAIKKVGDNEKGDVYAEGLELTVGGNDVVKYLGEQLNTDNQLLKESLIAAITNQGTRQAAELLFAETQKKGDPDGYYSLGIGLGEFVPEESAIPYLQELANKHDQYSHLAVKALLNSGLDGLKVVFDLLSNSKDAEADRLLLKDASDHVSLDEETEAYLKGIQANCKNESVCRFAKEALDAGAADESETAPANQSH